MGSHRDTKNRCAKRTLVWSLDTFPTHEMMNVSDIYTANKFNSVHQESKQYASRLPATSMPFPLPHTIEFWCPLETLSPNTPPPPSTSPGDHQYNSRPSLVDITATGGATWRSWDHLVHLSRPPPAWLQYAGRWGNPADCGNIIKAFCELATGPPGLAEREADFECGVPTSRSIWAALRTLWPFGRRRRDVAAMMARRR